jgi:hypothetical protein
LFFVDVGKDQTMVDDATMFLSLQVVLVQDEKLEQTSTDVNVFQ